jgi:O-antigen/teichoic acid export membrane protein
MLEWAFQGLQRMEFIGLSRSLYKIVFLVLVLLFVRSFQNVIVVPYLDFISAFLVGLIFFVVLWLQFPFSWGEIVPRQWSKLVMEALPLGISFFLIQLYYNLDMIMLGLMRGPEAVGWYSAAYKIFWIIYGFFLLWQTAVFPEVTRRLHENISRAGEFLQRYVRITLWACVPLVIYVMLGAPDIIKIVFGEQYVAAMPALQILISTLLLMVLNGIYGHLILIPAGKQNLLMFSVILGILLNFVLNLVLISRFSLYGAAAATVISEAVILLFAFYAARREISIRVMRWVTGPLVGALGAALFFGAGSWFFRSGAPELFFALCSAGYFLAYLVLTVWVMREWDFIYGFVKNVFRDMGSSELGNN